jgi:hypothetical protein
MKQSGVGPKGFRSDEALRFFTEPKNSASQNRHQSCDQTPLQKTAVRYG